MRAHFIARRKGCVLMIKHIVLWKLKESAAGNDREVNAAIIKERLEALVGRIEGLFSLSVKRNVMENGWDLCLVGEYRDKEALLFYRDHPLHKEVQGFVHEVITERASCDFEF